MRANQSSLGSSPGIALGAKVLSVLALFIVFLTATSIAMASDKPQISPLGYVGAQTHCEFNRDDDGALVFVILAAAVGEDNIETEALVSINGELTELAFERRRILPSIHKSGWGLDMRVYRSKADDDLAVTALIQPTNPDANELIGTVQVVSPDFSDKVYWTGTC